MIQSNVVRLYHDGGLWRAAIGGGDRLVLVAGLDPPEALLNLADAMVRLNVQCDRTITSDPLSVVQDETVQQRLDRVGYCQVDPVTLKPKG